MAWRIDEQVVRGEIDCRVRGRVSGRIWLAGRGEPLALELAGNPWRDLAGRVLRFTNPQPKEGGIEGLASEQHGSVGDITASRRVRVPGCPPGEMKRLRGAGEPCPWRWANALYLEWFGTRNGRVVIESSDYQLGKKQTPTKSGQGQAPTRPRTILLAIFLAKRWSDEQSPAMATARSLLVDPGRSGVFHCTSRCVRRAFLCGRDKYSGRDYEHRRGWIRDHEKLARCRKRLADLSWFMRSLNEPIARRANREDECKGHFWEGRFNCQRLEDAGAVLISLERYLELLDWTGRQIRSDKRGHLSADLRPALERLELDAGRWVENVERFGGLFCRVAGTLRRLRAMARATGRAWLRGHAGARRLYAAAG